MRILPSSLVLILGARATCASQYPGHVKDFHWTRPFPYDNTAPLHTETKCEVTRTFRAEQWTLGDLRSSPWRTAIDTYTGWHSYPGSWEGADHGSQQRQYLIMDWLDVPVPVRRWVDAEEHHDRKEGTQGKWWMFGQFERPITLRRYGDLDRNGTSVQDADKVLLFAPAAMYEILPLWVAEGSECDGNVLYYPDAFEHNIDRRTAEMLDLSNYSSHPTDNSVIAWPVNHQVPDTGHGKKDITFDIKAFYVIETEHGRAWREMWEKMYRTIRRQERKMKREERMAKRSTLGSLDTDEQAHVKDEL